MNHLMPSPSIEETIWSLVLVVTLGLVFFCSLILTTGNLVISLVTATAGALVLGVFHHFFWEHIHDLHLAARR